MTSEIPKQVTQLTEQVIRLAELVENLRQQFNLPLFEVADTCNRIYPDWRWKGLLQGVSDSVRKDRENAGLETYKRRTD